MAVLQHIMPRLSLARRRPPLALSGSTLWHTTTRSLQRASSLPVGFVARNPTCSGSHHDYVSMTIRLFHNSDVVLESKTKSKLNELFDDEGNFVPTPEILPATRITSDPLPDEIQRAVREHVRWACRPLQKKRDLVRHWKIDSNRSSKNKRKALVTHFVVTPYVLIGAYRRLLKRVQKRRQDGLAAKNIREADIPFGWFQSTADSLAMSKFTFKNTEIKAPNTRNTDCQTLIIKEAMAMYMLPAVSPFLPPHAWCLQEDPEEYQVGTKAVESIGKKAKDEIDKSKPLFLLWDLGIDGEMKLEKGHVKIISNMARPYVSLWWTEMLPKVFNMHGKKEWIITNDETSCLPALVIDMLLLRFDRSASLHKFPLWAWMQQNVQSERNLSKAIMPLPKKLQGVADANYYRFGPTLLVKFKGPTSLQEKLLKAASLELMSALQFDKKLITQRAFSVQKPQLGKRQKRTRKTQRAGDAQQ